MLHMISGSHNPDHIQKACGFGKSKARSMNNVQIHSTPLCALKQDHLRCSPLYLLGYKDAAKGLPGQMLSENCASRTS